MAIPMIVLLPPCWLRYPEPIFFAQTRNGLDDRPFRMWKLRTMVPNADRMLDDLILNSEEARADWTHWVETRHDPRIIPVLGHFMRRYSIDELPQLWNVVIVATWLIVGPRPLPPYHLERLIG